MGVAAAVAVLDEDEVAAGLPGGAVHFIGTDPSCTMTDDPDVFDCVLARAPLYDFWGGRSTRAHRRCRHHRCRS